MFHSKPKYGRGSCERSNNNGESGLMVMGGDSWSGVREFESPHRTLDGYFSHVLPICIVFKRPKINQQWPIIVCSEVDWTFMCNFKVFSCGCNSIYSLLTKSCLIIEKTFGQQNDIRLVIYSAPPLCGVSHTPNGQVRQGQTRAVVHFASWSICREPPQSVVQPFEQFLMNLWTQI